MAINSLNLSCYIWNPENLVGQYSSRQVSTRVVPCPMYSSDSTALSRQSASQHSDSREVRSTTSWTLLLWQATRVTLSQKLYITHSVSRYCPRLAVLSACMISAQTVKITLEGSPLTASQCNYILFSERNIPSFIKIFCFSIKRHGLPDRQPFWQFFLTVINFSHYLSNKMPHTSNSYIVLSSIKAGDSTN